MGVVLHRVTIGRSREVRGPDAFERGVAGMIIALVMAIAMGFGVRLVHMAQTLDAVSVASGAQINAVVYRAEHGRWPPPGDRNVVAAGTHGSYVTRLELGEGGVITAEVVQGPVPGFPTSALVPGNAHGFLSFRPQLLGSKDTPGIAFLCGYAKPLAGAIGTSATNRTTLPRDYLPPFCR